LDLAVCILFDDHISNSDSIQLKEMITENNELEMMQKKKSCLSLIKSKAIPVTGREGR
jgi:hypothetical protein